MLPVGTAAASCGHDASGEVVPSVRRRSGEERSEEGGKNRIPQGLRGE